MLAVPRAEAAVKRFFDQLYDADQYLHLSKNPSIYPEFVPEVGAEMRTELAIGETVTELIRNLSADSSQMLVLGITDITHAGSAYRSLLAAKPGWPVLIVYCPVETRTTPELVASGTAA